MRSILILTFLILGVFATGGQAESVTVPANASGKFGRLEGKVDPTAEGMVVGFVFAGPGKVSITAGGTISLHPGVPALRDVPPEGDRWFTYKRPHGTYTPLEESLVDSRGLDALSAVADAKSILIAAFVPAETVKRSGFRPWNVKLGGGIPAGALFVVASGPQSYEAGEAGTLFLGINDPRVANNNGQFSVQIVRTND